jgi:hypothetical protein
MANKYGGYAKYIAEDGQANRQTPTSASIEAAALGFLRSSSSPTNTPNLRPGFPFAVPMDFPSCSSRSRGKSSSVFGGIIQGGFVSILYAIAEFPLELWEKQARKTCSIFNFYVPKIFVYTDSQWYH